jgi:hypothetical protein
LCEQCLRNYGLNALRELHGEFDSQLNSFYELHEELRAELVRKSFLYCS